MHAQADTNGEFKRYKKLFPLAVAAGAFGLATAVFMPFISPALRRVCLPYVPASPKQIENISTFLRDYLLYKNNNSTITRTITGSNNSLTKNLLDLGSGDGRVVFACSQIGVQLLLQQQALPQQQASSPSAALLKCTGVELNYWLVLYSRIKALFWSIKHSQQQQQHNNNIKQNFIKPRFYRRNLFHEDFSQYDIIVLFGVDSMMHAVATKLEQELSNDAVFIACRFPLPPSAKFVPYETIGRGIDKIWVYRGSDISKCNRQNLS